MASTEQIQNEEKADTASFVQDEQYEEFTLRSNFAMRNSHYKSVTSQVPAVSCDNSNVGQTTTILHNEDRADIAETLKVIDSARRFLNASKDPSYHLGSIETICNDPDYMKRDMSKETLKHGQSAQEYEENQLNITREAFKDDLEDAEISHRQSSNHQGNQSDHTKLIGANLLDEPISIFRTKQAMPSRLSECDITRSSQDERSVVHAGTAPIEILSALNAQRANQDTLIKIEMESANMHQSQQQQLIKGVPLRALAPMVHVQQSQDLLQRKPRQDSKDLDAQIRAAGFISNTESIASTNRSKDGEIGGSMSPRALQVDLVNMMADGDDAFQTNEERLDTVERSQLYETGQQSEALRSISRAHQSAETPDMDTMRALDSKSPEFEQIQQPPPLITSGQTTAQENSPIFETVINSQLNRSRTAKEVINSSLVVDRSRNEHVIGQNTGNRDDLNVMAITCLTTERKTSENDTNSEVKQKISLNYEKLELENKLNEMADAILNFKNQYVPDGSINSPTSASRSSHFVETTRTRKSAACSPRSGERSPPKKIIPRAGKPKALKVRKGKSQNKECKQSQRVTCTVQNETSQDQTLTDYDDEQTFRHPRITSASLRSRENLHKNQSFEQLRQQRREVECKEVVREQEQQPYDQFVSDLENETRAEIRRTRFQETATAEGLQSSRSNLKQNLDESQEPMPQALPKLLAHDTSTFDGRYFTAMSPTNTSGAPISHRTGHNSYRQQDRNGNLVSCLRLSKQSVVNSARGYEGSFSPRGRTQLGKNDSQQVQSQLLRRPNSYTQASGFFGDHHHTGAAANGDKNFNNIMSTSEKSHRNRQNRKSGAELAQNESHRRVCNISGFEGLVKKMNDKLQLQQSTLGTASVDATERSRQVQNTTKQPQHHANQSSGVTGPSHNTQRSMGIESFCQKQQDVGGAKHAAAAGQLGSMQYAVEIQERGEHFVQQLSHRRANRQEIEDNKNELLGLRGERKLNRMQIEQKDLALTKLRDENGELKKIILELQEQVADLQSEVNVAGDQELFRKFKEVLGQKDEIANKLASTEFQTSANQKSHDLMKRSYEALKQNQLELVQMNKKLIARHQKEADSLEQELANTKQLLKERTKKVIKFSEVIKSFDDQINAFEGFQQKTLTEMSQLQSQVQLFQGLFEREKMEKSELIKKLRPSQRPIHDSLKKQIEGKLQRVPPGVTVFDEEAADITTQREQEHNVQKQGSGNIENPAGLTQTMSKNLSFGQPFHPDLLNFNSGKSSKGQYYHDRIDSGGRRVSSHAIDLPLQILSETSSDKIIGESEVKEKRCWSQDSRRPNEACINVQDDIYPILVPRVQRYDSARGSFRQQQHTDQIQPISSPETESPQRVPTRTYSKINNSIMPPRPERHVYQYQRRPSSAKMQNSNSVPDVGLDHAINYANITQQHGLVDTIQADPDVTASDNYLGGNQQKSFATVEHDTSTRQLSNCASAGVYQRKLNFKKPRPASSASHKQGLNISSQGQTMKFVEKPSAHQTLSPKDYYCRLKEMQRRLDRARNDISKNVSRSRSKSPTTATNTSAFVQAQQTTIELQQQNSQNRISVSRSSNKSFNTLQQQLQQVPTRDQYRPYVPVLTSNVPKTTSASASNERRQTPKSQHNRSRQQMSKGPVISSSQQKFQPLFYTSLYNGVQPLPLYK